MMRSSVTFVGAALVMALAGCSSSNNAGPDLGAFEGTWTPTAVTETVSCTGNPSETNPVTATLTFAQSATNSSDLVVSNNASSCTFTATVSGSSATVASGATCTTTGTTSTGVAETVNSTVTSYTFAVNSSDTTATITGAGSANVIENGTTTACTYQETGTFTKSTN